MYSTAYTSQNVILDLASSDPSSGYIDALREESARVLKEAGGSWTRQAVTKLKLVDSAIRESMRIRPFNSVGVPRTVAVPDGVSVPHGSSQLHLPLGTIVTLPVEPIHMDNDIYPDAEQYHPFRFAQPGAVRSIFETNTFRSEEDSRADNGTPKGTEAKQKSSVTLDDAFLGFGFGRSACPGRFFVMNEVKIFIAEMLLNYDLRYMQNGRPMQTPVIWLNVPLNDGKVYVRRRQMGVAI